MAELLLQAVLEFDLLEPVWKAYSGIREALDKQSIKGRPEVPDTRAVKRLFFEVVAFAAFVVMGQEVPKWLTRKNPVGQEEPDVEWIRYYNTQFLNRMRHDLESSEFAGLREVILISMQPAITFGDGEPLSIVRRVSGYLAAGSTLEAARDFAQFAALAMDAERSVLLQPIALRLVGSIVDVSRILLKGVFTRELSQRPLS